MKNQKGISLMKLIFIVIIAVIAIFVVLSNFGKTKVNLQWGAMPSPEYYELSVAALESQLYGSGAGTLSRASFNTLGRDVKNAGGKWFKDSNVNFKASVFESGGVEIVTLTDGKHTASFTAMQNLDYVIYTFEKEGHTGYKITIK